MNTGVFTGNLTKNCRTGATPTGTSMVNFTLAVSIGYGDNEKTEYVECSLFGKRAEGKLPQYLVKGASVLVMGGVQLKQRDHEGKHYTNMSVMVDNLDLTGGKPQPSAPLYNSIDSKQGKHGKQSQLNGGAGFRGFYGPISESCFPVSLFPAGAGFTLGTGAFKQTNQSPRRALNHE